MITLRDLARTDTAIGSITMKECQMFAKVLQVIGDSWFLRLFMPKDLRSRSLEMQLLAATLSRTPKERIPLTNQISLSMEKDGLK